MLRSQLILFFPEDRTFLAYENNTENNLTLKSLRSVGYTNIPYYLLVSLQKIIGYYKLFLL